MPKHNPLHSRACNLSVGMFVGVASYIFPLAVLIYRALMMKAPGLHGGACFQDYKDSGWAERACNAMKGL